MSQCLWLADPKAHAAQFIKANFESSLLPPHMFTDMRALVDGKGACLFTGVEAIAPAEKEDIIFSDFACQPHCPFNNHTPWLGQLS